MTSFGTRAKRLRMAAACMAAILLSPGAALGENGAGVTTSHGYAVFGTLKYGPDFTHYDYVNPDAPKGGTYRYADTFSFDSLNNISLRSSAPMVQTLLQDSLMKQSTDETASFYCLVCETITYPADLSWAEFRLNPDARFQDGHPITAEDIIYTVELGRDPLTVPSISRVVETIDRIESDGPHHLRVHYKMKDNPTLPTVIALMPIMPRHYWEAHDVTRAARTPPVMAGPYRIGEFFTGRFIEFERDPDYWARNHPINRGRYNFDRLRIDIYRDQQLADEAFNAGIAHLRVEQDAQVMERVRKLPAAMAGDIVQDRLPYANGTIYNSLTFNTRRKFLSDRRVRKALSLAYDFEWVKRVILGGDYGRVTSNFANSEFVAKGLPKGGELALLERHKDTLPPEIFTSAPSISHGGSRKAMRANLLAARKLLREAGYQVVDMKLVDPDTGAPVVLDMLSYSPLLIDRMGLFIQNLAKLGIEVRFRSLDTAQMRLMTRSYDFDLALIRPVFAPLPTPGAGMATIWSTAAAQQPSSMNYNGMQEPAVDEALEQMIAATDRQTVLDSMRAMDRVERFQYYSIPLQHLYPSPVGELPISYWDRFGRPDVHAPWNFDYRALNTWWWDAEKEAQLHSGAFR